jgi:fimbrial chaperone protein
MEGELMLLSAKSYYKSLIALACASAWMAPPVAHAAFELNPITANLSPSGPKAMSSFTVQNTTDEKLPVQINIVPREPDVFGKEVYKDSVESDDQFQIYPSQLILNPREKRTVRVSWVGNPNVKVEQCFRIIAEELPFDIEDPNKTYNKPTGKVRVATKYIGSIYITPQGALSNLVANIEPIRAAEPQLNLDLQNTGNAHQVLKKSKLKLTSAANKATAEIPSDQLDGLLYNQNVLPGKTRRFTMPWPKNIPVGPVKASFETQKE